MYDSPQAIAYNRTSFATDWISLAYTIHALHIGVDVYERAGFDARPDYEEMDVYKEVMGLVQE